MRCLPTESVNKQPARPDPAATASIQIETKFPKSFLELLGIIWITNVKVRRYDYSQYVSVTGYECRGVCRR
jgi:hypothetical protein